MRTRGKHICQADPDVAARARPLPPPPPQQGGPQSAPNQALPQWIREAVIVVDRYKSIEALPDLPPTMSAVPTHSAAARDAFSSILVGINQALKTPGLSDLDKENIWKVYALLPRFLCNAPCRHIETGDEVAVFPGFRIRVQEMLKPGGPSALWNDHLQIVAVAKAKKYVGQDDNTEVDEETFVGKLIDVAERAMDMGDCSAAYKALMLDSSASNMSREKAFSLLQDKYQYGVVPPSQCEQLANVLLDDAISRGLVQPGDLENRLDKERLSAATKSATRVQGADPLGWRPYVVRQMMHPGATVLNAAGQQAYVDLANAIAERKIPKGAREFFYSIGMAIWRDRESRKVRMAHAPFVLMRNAFAAEASISKAPYAKVMQPFQVAGGVRGGSEVMAHLKELMMEQAPTGMANFKWDWMRFFYAANREESIRAHAKAGLWPQMMAVCNAVGGEDWKVVYRGTNGQNHVFPAPPDGFPPGHPLAGNAAMLPIIAAWGEARNIVVKQLLTEAGAPQPGSPEFRKVVESYNNDMEANMFVDDGSAWGYERDMVATFSTFVDICEERKIAIPAPDKNLLSMVNGEPVPIGFQVAMTVAMATREQKRCYKLKVEVARQNGEAGLVMPDIPLISTVKYGDFTGDDLLENGQPNYDKPGVGGSVLLGAIHGTQEFMAHHAGRMAKRLMKQDARLSQYPRLQGQNFLRRVCAGGTVNHHERLQGDHPVFGDGVYSLFDSQTSGALANILGQEGLTTLQQRLTYIPIRKGGGGNHDAATSPGTPWMAAHLVTAKFVMDNYRPGHIYRRTLEAVQGPFRGNVGSQRPGAPYHERLDKAMQSFSSLFCSAQGWLPDPAKDGFEMNLRDLAEKRPFSFQRFAKVYQTKLALAQLRPHMNRVQAVGFQAQQAPGAGVVLTAIPTQYSPFSLSNPVFSFVLQRRYLNQKIGALGTGDSETRCAIGGCTGLAEAGHFESCMHTPIKNARHEEMRMWTKELLDFSNVAYDAADLRCHQGVRDRMAASGVVNNAGAMVLYGSASGPGNSEGMDLLVHSLFAPGDEVALDFTVRSDRCPTRVAATTASTPNQPPTPAQEAASLKGEEIAKQMRYKHMYEPINIKAVGMAADLAGGLGPNVIKIIKRCEVLAEGRLPEWANWSHGSSFTAVWRQRLIILLQAKNAQCVIANAARSEAARNSTTRRRAAWS